MSIFVTARDIHQVAKDHGFWEPATAVATLPTKVALIHTEIEEFREDESPEELADVVIRALDLAVALDIDVHHFATLDRLTTRDTPGIRMEPVEMVALELHRRAAAVTQADRRHDEAATRQFLLGLISYGMFALVQRGLDPMEEIRNKNERNRSRPRMHGRKY